MNGGARRAGAESAQKTAPPLGQGRSRSFRAVFWCACVERRLRAAHPAGNQEGDQRQGAEAEAHAQRRAGVAGLGRGVVVPVRAAAGGTAGGAAVADVADVDGVVLVHVAEGVGAVIAVVQDAVDVDAVDGIAPVGGEG